MNMNILLVIYLCIILIN